MCRSRPSHLLAGVDWNRSGAARLLAPLAVAVALLATASSAGALPFRPTGLTVSCNGSSAALWWNDNTDPHEGYAVYRSSKTNGASSWGPWQAVGITGVDWTSPSRGMVDPAAPSGVELRYTARAFIGDPPAPRLFSDDSNYAYCPTEPFLTRSGKQLTLDNVPYRPMGLNIYGANSRSNCGGTLGTAGLGLDTALADIPNAGNTFRAWFFQSLATTSGRRDWTAFDHTLAVARAHGLKVIATLTNQWGDCEQGGYKDAAWYTSGYKLPDPGGTTSYRDWAAEIAARYKNDPTIAAWQLVNEAEVKTSSSGGCSPHAEQTLKAFASDVAGVIKSADPNHLVSLGTIGSGQCGAQGHEYRDLHSVASIDMCEYHDYDPHSRMPGDKWNGLQVRLNQCAALGKPLIVGETGIKPKDVGGTLQDRANAFDAKFTTQLRAGVAGELVWAWNSDGSTLADFDVGPGDPTLGVLAAHR
jgi:mannan endo-1,4-beta-mannosidase